MKHLIPNLLGVLLMFFLFSCQKEGSFELGKPATGSLQSELSGECLPKTVFGAYIVDSVLTDSNYIEMEVNVTSTGPYTIFTDTVNGYFFRASGVFSQTGLNRIKLNGSGKPLLAGTDDFVVIYDTSFCLLPITVLPASSQPGTGQPGNSNDLLPLTKNTWWSYIDPGFSADDSIILKNVKTEQVAGKTYHLVQFIYDGEVLDTVYYRKSGNDYFEYMPVDNYSLIPFDTEIKGDVLFLKEGMKNGDTWHSTTYSGKFNGQSVGLRYEFNCTGANISATVGGQTFNNVFKITFKPQISVVPNMFADGGVTFEVLYAKGIGMISFKDNANGVIAESIIKSWKVY